MRALRLSALVVCLAAIPLLQAGDADAQTGAIPDRQYAQVANEGQRVALLVARLQELQEEVRRLRGLSEELGYRQERTDARIDTLIADIDERLRALEAAMAVPAQPDGLGSQAPAIEPEPSLSDATPPSATADTPPATTGATSGILPRDALLGLDRPADAPASEPDVAALEPSPQLSADPGERYQQGLTRLRENEWDAAATTFRSFVEDFPDDSRASVATYWLGETQYVQRNYAEAAATFAGGYRTYGADSPRAAEMLLKLGMSLARMGDVDRACETFAELANRHADAPTPVRQSLERERVANAC